MCISFDIEKPIKYVCLKSNKIFYFQINSVQCHQVKIDALGLSSFKFHLFIFQEYIYFLCHQLSIRPDNKVSIPYKTMIAEFIEQLQVLQLALKILCCVVKVRKWYLLVWGDKWFCFFLYCLLSGKDSMLKCLSYLRVEVIKIVVFEFQQCEIIVPNPLFHQWSWRIQPSERIRADMNDMAFISLKSHGKLLISSFYWWQRKSKSHFVFLHMRTINPAGTESV